MSRTRIKFCGLRRKQDLECAVALGVDAVGFVMVPASKRCLSLNQAAKLRERVPAFVNVVTLLMDAPARDVRAVIKAVQPDLLQFHGNETAEFCASFGLPYIKAVAMSGPVDLARFARRYRGSRGLLLDSHAPGQMGGSGTAFDWTVATPTSMPLILAGGLNAQNVGKGIAQVRPYAVDVSSGIELQPGVKDVQRMRAFVDAVARADRAWQRKNDG
ncbi:phosphoribosylanthranilate isomerase [Sinimarinibacterium sp. CAU 1509]|uniref:phosphoribosylanthranilate isomerase n=1 Tax=Sinimarinibacterium sp. CAU 1509 TaxID=2562283 RepID=UPI0010ABEE6F|nr:phosphoribosylanthranilate isomerase [Sinimarinibacterium sp. CAU 1509]TJY62242.1 phosphoribosylanthranilate isomerase [Sinimarinibacterium sp. CAU 1509]